MALLKSPLMNIKPEGGREGGREGGQDRVSFGKVREVGRYGCQNDGLDEADTIGKE